MCSRSMISETKGNGPRDGSVEIGVIVDVSTSRPARGITVFAASAGLLLGVAAGAAQSVPVASAAEVSTVAMPNDRVQVCYQHPSRGKVCTWVDRS